MLCVAVHVENVTYISFACKRRNPSPRARVSRIFHLYLHLPLVAAWLLESEFDIFGVRCLRPSGGRYALVR